VVDRALRAVVQIVRLQDLKVFLTFTQLLLFFRASDLVIIASSLLLFLFKLLSQMFRQLGDRVDGLTGTKDGVFLELEGRKGALLSLSLNLVALLLNTSRFKSLGQIMLNLGDQSLLDVNNELRFTILSLDLLNLALLVEDSERRLKPGLQRSGDLLNLAMSLLGLPVLGKFHIFIIVADKLGVLKLQVAGAVRLGLDADLSGKSHTRELVVQLRNSSKDLSRVLVSVFLVRCPAEWLDATTQDTSH